MVWYAFLKKTRVLAKGQAKDKGVIYDLLQVYNESEGELIYMIRAKNRLQLWFYILERRLQVLLHKE